jgi:SAM-dependent methyltransferase
MGGIKASIANLPGTLVLHRLLKNLRYTIFPGWTTKGGLGHARMDADEAVRYTAGIFAKVDRLVDGHGGWAGRRVLEIGPGDSLATGLHCLAAGAASYGAVDRFAVGFDPDLERAVFDRIAAGLAPEKRLRCADVLAAAGPAGDAFRYWNDLPVERAPAVLGEGAWDVVFSNAVLEHVADVPGTLAACRRLLAPGGLMLHEVDLRSHQTYQAHPLQFLEYPDWSWRLQSSRSGEPNRVRLPEYRRLLADAGFLDVTVTVTEAFPRELLARVRPRLAPRFRGMADEDLEPAVVVLTGRAP